MSFDYGLCLLAAFLASLVSGLGGFGGGFIIVLFLAPVVGPKAVIPLVAAYAIFGNISRILVYRRNIDWPLVGQFTLASLPGVYIGANVFVWMNEAMLGVLLGLTLIILGVLLGLTLIIAVPIRRILKKYEFHYGIKTIIGFGFLFGTISGTTAGSGMFVIAGLSGLGLGGVALLGTDAAIGLVNAIARSAAYWRFDSLPRDIFIAGLLMGLVTFPGTWIASRLVAMMGMTLHNLLIEGLIIGGGVFLIYQASGL